MNEPYRLREQCESSLERSLLDAGVAYRSPLSARAKTLAALGLAGSAAVSVSAASAASAQVATKLGWSWTKLLAVTGLGAAAAVPAGYYAWELASDPVQPASITAPEVAPLQVAPAPPPTAVSFEAAPIAEAPVAEAPAPLAPTPKADARSSPASASSQSALAAELAALDAARSRLHAGDAPGALARLDDYSRSYPRGRLALEAEVLRIDALSRSGQRAAAEKRAATFLRRHPNSVLASRVRAYLND